MQAPFLHVIQQQQLWFCGLRYIFWEEAKAIILSDVHIGKTGHFRKHGIAVPANLLKEELQRLLHIITFHKAEQLIVVGDLFHSYANNETDIFLQWRKQFPQFNFSLVKGNHDILPNSWYEEANIQVHQSLYLAPFNFIHDLNDIHQNINNQNYYFSGHIHPGIQLKGMGKQNLRFPCFYCTPQFTVLPAFSKFTGLANIKPKKEDVVFAIVNDGIVKI